MAIPDESNRVFKILAVDDSKVIRAFIKTNLESEGYEVVTANSAQEALDIVGEVNPDLITTDVTMPGMDGYELCAALRNIEQCSRTPVIMITSNDPLYSRSRGFEVGAIDFISKPFEKEELQHAVDKVLKPKSLYAGIKILVVDDSRMVRSMVLQVIQEFGACAIQAKNGQEALCYLRTHKNEVNIVITDNIMPEMDGMQLCQHIRDESLIHPRAPILFLSAAEEKDKVLTAFTHGATDYIAKPFFREELLHRLRSHLENVLNDIEKSNQLGAMSRKFAQRNQEIMQTQAATISLMGALTECRDPETGAHIQRTQEYVRVMAEALLTDPKYAGALDIQWVENVIAAAPLHDIGKVGIPDAVLLKPGKLTDEEFSIMQHHAEFGRKVLFNASSTLGFDNFLSEAARLAGGHHEKWNGEGYPSGLKGEDIPLSARIMAIADVYDALISKRVYKPAMTHENAVKVIVEGRGTHFDPHLTDIFIKLADKFRSIQQQYPD